MPGPPKKYLSLEAAAELVRDRDSLAVPLGPGQPAAFLHALGQRDRFDDLVVFAALLTDLFTVFTKPGVRLRSGFFGPVERGLLGAGHDVSFIPADFRQFEKIAREMQPRVMATSVAPLSDDGTFSLSLHAGATIDEFVRAGEDPDRLLVVEINPNLPRTFGLPPEFPHALPLDLVDVVVESNRRAFRLPAAEPSKLEQSIATHALQYIHDGCTLQTGIGGVPTKIAELLAAGNGGDYGIHSEMFTEGLWKLHQAGKVTNHKGIYDGFSITTFAVGSAELYSWLDGQDAVRFLPVGQVNSVEVISRCRNFVSINGALAVDLLGQMAADTVGPRQYSGIGGHFDFTFGAGFSQAGTSLICLPSTAEVGGERISRIGVDLPFGSAVTSPRHASDVIITEHGSAELSGKTVHERAAELIRIAHPDFREDLAETWQKRNRA